MPLLSFSLPSRWMSTRLHIYFLFSQVAHTHPHYLHVQPNVCRHLCRLWSQFFAARSATTYFRAEKAQIYTKRQYVNDLLIIKWHHRWHKKWVWYWSGADKWRKTFSSCSATVYCEEKVRNIIANMSFILHSFFLLPFPIVSQKLLFKEVFLY